MKTQKLTFNQDMEQIAVAFMELLQETEATWETALNEDGLRVIFIEVSADRCISLLNEAVNNAAIKN